MYLRLIANCDERIASVADVIQPDDVGTGDRFLFPIPTHCDCHANERGPCYLPLMDPWIRLDQRSRLWAYLSTILIGVYIIHLSGETPPTSVIKTKLG